MQYKSCQTIDGMHFIDGRYMMKKHKQQVITFVMHLGGEGVAMALYLPLDPQLGNITLSAVLL